MKRNIFFLIGIIVLIVMSSCYKNRDLPVSKNNNNKDSINFHLYEQITLKKSDYDSDKESMSLDSEQVEKLLKTEEGKKFLLEKLKETEKPIYVLTRGTNAYYFVSGFKLKNGKIKQMKQKDLRFWGYKVNIIGTN